MPKNANTVDGAAALGLTADDPAKELEGVEEVKQGKSRYNDVVIDFTKAPKVLIPDGTTCHLQIKQARPAATKAGFPKASIMYIVREGDFEGEAFWDDLLFIPPQPPKKGTMWRVHQFVDAIGYELPSGIGGDEIISFMKRFCEDLLGEELDAEINVVYDPNNINDKTGEPYEARNGVKKFIKPGSRSLDDLLG